VEALLDVILLDPFAAEQLEVRCDDLDQPG
jgi:hypothetical protein